MSIFSNKNNKLGFTLIELLVVIAIIGVLSVLAVLALGSARIKARDSKRMTDLNQIGKALDLYYDDNKAYPTIITPGLSLASPDGSKVYLTKIPSNPRPRNDNGAPDEDYSYSVNDTSNPTQFDLSTSLGSSVNGTNQGRISIFGLNGGGGSMFFCGQQIEDSDGNKYNTVQIGSQCWMKENLRRGVMINNNQSQADANNGNIEKYCYGNNPTNCTNYGALYQWHTVMAMTQHCDWTNEIDCTINNYHRGICPIGWHVPSFTDYETLVHGIDDNSTCNLDCWNGPCDCNTSGGKLKVTPSNLPVSWDGTDNYNFSTVPAGSTGPGAEMFLDEQSFAWISTPLGADPASSAYAFNLTGGGSTSFGAGLNHAIGFSLRCIKN